MNTMMSSVVINVQLLGRNAHQLDAECKSLNKWDPHGSKRFYRIGVYGPKSDASNQVIRNTKDQIFYSQLQAYDLGFIHFLSFSHNFTVTSNMCEFRRLNNTSPKAELIKNGSYLLFTLISCIDILYGQLCGVKIVIPLKLLAEYELAFILSNVAFSPLYKIPFSLQIVLEPWITHWWNNGKSDTFLWRNY